jgi:hypothetical protein
MHAMKFANGQLAKQAVTRRRAGGSSQIMPAFINKTFFVFFFKADKFNKLRHFV